MIAVPPGFIETSFAASNGLPSSMLRGPPEKAIPDPRTLRGTLSVPPPCLWIHRRRCSNLVGAETLLQAELDQIVLTFRATSAGVVMPFAFTDGKAGVVGRIDIKLGEARSVQTVAARIDNDIVTILIAAVSALGENKWQAVLATTMASFRP